MFNKNEILKTLISEYDVKTTKDVQEMLKDLFSSTIHKDVTERLEEINPSLALEVKRVLEKNKSERHIRGGMATKLKYEKEKKVQVYPSSVASS